MNNILLEEEILVTSTYCSIVIQILKQHKILSVNKMLIFAFITKKSKINDSLPYNGKHKIDLCNKSISIISGLFDNYTYDIKFIIGAIHLLILNNKITISNNVLLYIENDESIKIKKDFLNKAITSSKTISDRQFLKEVINIV